MTVPRVSVVVASLGRPRELARCVTGLALLRYRPVEVVVVACAAGRAALAGRPKEPWLRVLPNPGTGIAEARNLGISAAAGAMSPSSTTTPSPNPHGSDTS
jgi:O-antigen biosynthesis protein